MRQKLNLFRGYLTERDWDLLSEAEARGCWGPGVFPTTGDNREP